LRSLGARGCYLLAPGELSFSGCAALTLKSLGSARLRRFATGRARQDVGSIALSSPFRARAGHTRGVAARRRPSYVLGDAKFVLQGIGEVYRVTRFDGAGSLKLAWRF